MIGTMYAGLEAIPAEDMRTISGGWEIPMAYEFGYAVGRTIGQLIGAHADFFRTMLSELPKKIW
ncbi:hypothetical protein ACWKWU_03035 [Chitinophaga lutea]